MFAFKNGEVLQPIVLCSKQPHAEGILEIKSLQKYLLKSCLFKKDKYKIYEQIMKDIEENPDENKDEGQVDVDVKKAEPDTDSDDQSIDNTPDDPTQKPVPVGESNSSTSAVKGEDKGKNDENAVDEKSDAHGPAPEEDPYATSPDAVTGMNKVDPNELR